MGNLRDKPDRATPYKIDYLRKTIKDGKVYKFISFDGELSLVRTKIDTLKQGKIWFSFYKTLNDETEFQINYDGNKIAMETGRSVSNVHLLINYLRKCMMCILSHMSARIICGKIMHPMEMGFALNLV